MAIKEHSYSNEIVIVVESADDLIEIVDRLHTEVEDNLGGDARQQQILDILSTAQSSLRELV